VTQDLAGAEGAELQGENVPPAEPLGELQTALHKKLKGARQGVRLPDAKRKSASGSAGSKPRKTKESCSPRYNASYAELQLQPSEDAAPPKRPLIIAFDTEWVAEREPPEPDADEQEDDVEPTPPRNTILSYQYACRFLLDPGEEPAAECEWSGIIYTRHARALLNPHLSEGEVAEIPERIKFADLLGQAIARGIELGKLRAWPTEVIAAGHWTRADLASMADYAEIKNQFDAVRKTYVSFQPYQASFTQKKRRHVRKFEVHLMDTMLLSPGGNASLDQLGQMYGFPKLETGRKEVNGEFVPYKSNMDLYLVDHPAKFEAYAVRDAEICALHLQSMAKFCQDDLKLDCGGLPHTLGAIAVKFLLKHWADNGIELGAVNGFEIAKGKVFNPNTQRYNTTKFKVPNRKVEIHQEMAALASYGGRNETFWFGATPVGDFREFDIVSAYTTALSSLQMLDYSSARPSTDLNDYTPDQVGFALVRFQFPVGRRYPCLPVKADDQRGLIYPMSGETYATSPEIEAAVHLGAEVEIVHGAVIPWVPRSPRPFESVLVEFANRRWQNPDKSPKNLMYKELGNCLYGKTYQGTKEKKAYNTRTDRHEEIGESPITNIFIAAHVTGLVRALLGELIAGVPDHYIVVSATTDSIITNCPLAEIPLTGPVARYLRGVRKRFAALDQSGRTKTELLDVKSHTAQLLSWRTRGIATLQPIAGEPIKLAKGGMKVEAQGTDAQNAWLVERFLTSKPLEKFPSTNPLPFTTAHRKAADHRFVTVEKTANFEYDHKRRIVAPASICAPIPRGSTTMEILGARTEPWQTVAEFNAYRELFEQWRYSGGGHRLKTIADWRDWQEFLAGASASGAGVRRSKNGVVQQALRIFWKAYTKQRWGLPGKAYREAAERLTAAGYTTKEQSFKDTLRDRKPPPENTIPAEAPGVRDLVLALLDLWPSFQWERLVRDAPPRWLGDLTQNDDARQVEQQVSVWDHRKVAVPDTMHPMHRMTECNLQLPPLPEEDEDPVTIVPLRPVLKPKFAPSRIA
jgi:DNA polymerase type B, organellar and viral